VLPNAADIDKFGQMSMPDATLARFDLRGNPIIIVVGGFFEWHDLGLVLESFKLVKITRPDASLVLVGDGDTRPAMTDTTQKLGLQDSVRFTGQVAHDLIPQLLALADIAIVPIKASTNGYGASPLKLYEYMAAGKAIIASCAGQNTEVLVQDRTCLFYEPRLGANARQDAVQKHSWDTYAEKLERIYENAIQKTS
jgi:glycosyltransferase involved in cell wall biosynthesis